MFSYRFVDHLKLLLLFVLLLGISPLHAEINFLSQSWLSRDTNRIKTYAKAESVWIDASAVSTTFTLAPLKVSPDQTIKPQLVSNTGLTIGGGFIYGYLIAEYSVLLPSTLRDKSNNARSAHLGLAKNARNYGIEGSFTKINGLLYLSPDSNDVFRPLHQLGNISYRNYSGTFSYFFNYKRFSYRAANQCYELQTRSAGSVIASVTSSYQILRSKDSAVLNSGYTSKTDSGNVVPINVAIGKFSTHRMALVGNIGYSYNFVWSGGKWSCNPAFSALVGTDHTILRTEGDKKDLPAFTFVRGLSWGLNFSYNCPDYYVLCNYRGQTATSGVMLIPNASVNVQSLHLEVGYRFRRSEKKLCGVF
ncbi:DUF4421 family protein [Taibaiella soli]|uniref:DUF4421 family protein n=1 Tax=Taibaiella soli TaxID=1649169 RepID=UPI001403316D|nr:DUF4421 family protein [Taibaiella soli]